LQQDLRAVLTVDRRSNAGGRLTLFRHKLDRTSMQDHEVTQRVAPLQLLLDAHESGGPQRFEALPYAIAKLARELRDRERLSRPGREPLEEGRSG
jgi:hypothetical protein